MTGSQRKNSTTPKAPELDFDTTQEIDPGLVDSILAGGEPTLTQTDFDDTEILLDLGVPARPARPQ